MEENCRRFESDLEDWGDLLWHRGEPAISDTQYLKALSSAKRALHFELLIAASLQDQLRLSLMLFISKSFISQWENHFISMTATRFDWPTDSQQLVVLEAVMVSACALFMIAGGGWNNHTAMRGLIPWHGAHIHLDDLIYEPVVQQMKQSLSSLDGLL